MRRQTSATRPGRMFEGGGERQRLRSAAKASMAARWGTE